VVGGISRTESLRGFLFDIGGHRFFTRNPAIRKLWSGMLGDDLITVRRISRIYYRGRFFHNPIRLVDTLVNLGPVESLRILASYLVSSVSPFPEEKSFEEWVSNRFGRRLYRIFFKTYTEKVWGIPCSSIRSDWAAQRIQGLSLGAAVVKALVGRGAAKTLIDAFDYPRLGPGMMWKRFADVVEEKGGRILLNAEVGRIRHREGRVLSVEVAAGGGVTTLEVDSLISSAPVTLLARLLDPAPPEAVLRAAAGLFHRSFLIVILILDGDDLFPDQWIYIHSPDVRVGRIQNFGNWSREMVPGAGTTSLGLEYFCDQGDGIWTMDDALLADMAAAELEVLGLASRSSVKDSHVVRQAMAYPVYDEGYKENVAVVRRYLEGFENLQTIGRNGMHRYNNMDHSMVTGIMAARNLRGERHEVWEVNEDAEYLEKGSLDLLDDPLLRPFARLHKRAFGIAVGSTLGLGLFLLTLAALARGGETAGPTLALLGQYFIGYSLSVTGSLIGLGYGFASGFISGWLFALVRNFLALIQFNSLRTREDRIHLRDFLDYF
jgi:protoporphyrinogen oxidase